MVTAGAFGQPMPSQVLITHLGRWTYVLILRPAFAELCKIATHMWTTFHDVVVTVRTPAEACPGISLCTLKVPQPYWHVNVAPPLALTRRIEEGLRWNPYKPSASPSSVPATPLTWQWQTATAETKSKPLKNTLSILLRPLTRRRNPLSPPLPPRNFSRPRRPGNFSSGFPHNVPS